MTSKAFFPAILALSLGATGFAVAQTATPTTPTTPTTPSVTTPRVTAPSNTSNAPVVSGTHSATNNSVNTNKANNAGAPVAGANSFTEGQARDRIQAKGYSQVTDLKLDGQGIWRGKGTRNGQSVSVALDYQGNVVPQ